jgi:hypothetical protein
MLENVSTEMWEMGEKFWGREERVEKEISAG